MFTDGMHEWGFGMGLGWIFTLLFLFALFYFINNNNNNNNNDKESARDILDKKYANGEIDEEEYKRKKELLKD